MIGKVLKYMRIKKNWNQSQLAKKIESAQTTLSGWETGFRQPTFETIERIADACGFEIVFKNEKTNEEFKASEILSEDR